MSTVQRLAGRGLIRSPRWLPGNVDALFTPATCVLHSTRAGTLVRENRRLFLH
jgi:hypothetical protein